MQHPWYPGRPPLPPKPGLSPLVIVLIVFGALSVVGLGTCALIGGLVMVGASAEADKQPTPITPSPPSTVAPPSTAPNGSLDDPNNDPTNGDPANGAPANAANDPNSSAPAPTGTSASSSGGAAKPAMWMCTASASVRVCGFAGACNYQMVFGNGVGSDRFLASQQAKMACENSARIKGSPTVCAVACSLAR